MPLTPLQKFAKKRNYCHFQLKGIVANLQSIQNSKAITPGEAAVLWSLQKKLTDFNTTFFSKSSRRLAQEENGFKYMGAIR